MKKGERHSARSKALQAKNMRAYWMNVRRTKPEQIEAMIAKRRATWVAKREKKRLEKIALGTPIKKVTRTNDEKKEVTR